MEDMPRQDFTDDERLLITALTAMCQREARARVDAQTEYERIGDIPAYQRRREGNWMSLEDAHLRVIRARRALERRRDREIRWLYRDVAHA